MTLNRYILPAVLFSIVFALLCFVPLTEVTKAGQPLGTWPLWTAYFGLFAGLWDRAWDVALFCAGVIFLQLLIASIGPGVIIWMRMNQK